MMTIIIIHSFIHPPNIHQKEHRTIAIEYKAVVLRFLPLIPPTFPPVYVSSPHFVFDEQDLYIFSLIIYIYQYPPGHNPAEKVLTSSAVAVVRKKITAAQITRWFVDIDKFATTYKKSRETLQRFKAGELKLAKKPAVTPDHGDVLRARCIVAWSLDTNGQAVNLPPAGVRLLNCVLPPIVFETTSTGGTRKITSLARYRKAILRSIVNGESTLDEVVNRTSQQTSTEQIIKQYHKSPKAKRSKTPASKEGGHTSHTGEDKSSCDQTPRQPSQPTLPAPNTMKDYMFLSDKPLRDFLELNNITSTVPKDVWQAGLQEDSTNPIIESIVFHDWVKSIQQQSIKQE